MTNSIRENVSDELLREICNGSPFIGALSHEVESMARELIEFRAEEARVEKKMAEIGRSLDAAIGTVGMVRRRNNGLN
ncbi:MULTISPECIES: hypothetical protein [Dickeya]|uniref:Uncharacterized protein n=1 Tax=Dickeya aquatica TaxID=1401087 RepID=A0A375A9W7_9GAMM|nr:MULTISPECIES: hypothetical protein [Dickeya]SLM62843.1 hypothetical protein DAQ1742_01913 [Dickeya aquatica]